MPKRRGERSLATAAVLFAALGDETRLALVNRLSTGGPASIAVLSESCGDISRQGVTKHLQVLASAGLVDSRREGREHVWALNPSRVEEARRALAAIAGQWDEAFARLKAHIERSAR
jgi:DNA-binding transcriptional ArsR family regulator